MSTISLHVHAHTCGGRRNIHTQTYIQIHTNYAHNWILKSVRVNVVIYAITIIPFFFYKSQYIYLFGSVQLYHAAWWKMSTSGSLFSPSSLRAPGSRMAFLEESTFSYQVVLLDHEQDNCLIIPRQQSSHSLKNFTRSVKRLTSWPCLCLDTHSIIVFLRTIEKQ